MINYRGRLQLNEVGPVTHTISNINGWKYASGIGVADGQGSADQSTYQFGILPDPLGRDQINAIVYCHTVLPGDGGVPYVKTNGSNGVVMASDIDIAGQSFIDLAALEANICASVVHNPNQEYTDSTYRTRYFTNHDPNNYTDDIYTDTTGALKFRQWTHKQGPMAFWFVMVADPGSPSALASASVVFDIDYGSNPEPPGHKAYFIYAAEEIDYNNMPSGWQIGTAEGYDYCGVESITGSCPSDMDLVYLGECEDPSALEPYYEDAEGNIAHTIDWVPDVREWVEEFPDGTTPADYDHVNDDGYYKVDNGSIDFSAPWYLNPPQDVDPSLPDYDPDAADYSYFVTGYYTGTTHEWDETDLQWVEEITIPGYYEDENGNPLTEPITYITPTLSWADMVNYSSTVPESGSYAGGPYQIADYKEIHWITAYGYTDIANGIITINSSTGYFQGCLTGDTKISLPCGGYKRIDEIHIGDEVLTEEGTTKVTKVKVVSSMRHLKYIFSDGTIVESSSDHRFFNLSKGFFEKMSGWKIGDKAWSENRTCPILIAIEKVEGPRLLYGIWTEENIYYANGLLSGTTEANRALIDDADLDKAIEMASSLTDRDLKLIMEGDVL